MATPQGRRLGNRTPEQVSNQEPPDSRPCILTTTVLGGIKWGYHRVSPDRCVTLATPPWPWPARGRCALAEHYDAPRPCRPSPAGPGPALAGRRAAAASSWSQPEPGTSRAPSSPCAGTGRGEESRRPAATGSLSRGRPFDSESPPSGIMTPPRPAPYRACRAESVTAVTFTAARVVADERPQRR